MLVLNRNSTCFGRVYRRRASLFQHGEPMTAITQPEIDQQVFNLYDEYCHGRIDRLAYLSPECGRQVLTDASNGRQIEEVEA